MMGMMISAEQAAAVAGHSGEVEWGKVIRPVGPQPIPDWCKGVHVRWMDGYANAPTIELKVHGDVRDWPDKVFHYASAGHRYQAKHPDGRLEQYAHSGQVSMQELRFFRRADGSLHEYRRTGAEWGVGQWGMENPEPGDWVDAPALATTMQQGFGGARVTVTMDDGRVIVLRGPWHVGAPAGYVEVSYTDVTEPWLQQMRGKQGWEEVGGRGGLYIADDLFVAIMSRYAAHLELVEVKYSWGRTVEPMKPEWDVPKAIIYDRDWQARQAARKSAA